MAIITVNNPAYGTNALVGDGQTDNSAKLDYLLTSESNNNDTLYFPRGVYKFLSPIDLTGTTVTAKKRNFQGDGPRESIILAGADMPELFKIGKNANSGTTWTPELMMSNLRISDIGFAAYKQIGVVNQDPYDISPQANPTANWTVSGVKLFRQNYFEFSNVDFRRFNGTALSMTHVEDGNLDNCAVRNSGINTNNVVASVFNPATYDGVTYRCNSLSLRDCTFERNFATGLKINDGRAISLIGCKFHGLTALDASTWSIYYNPVQLHLNDGELYQILMSQFVLTNKNAILIDGSSSVSSVISACTFNSADYLTTGATAPIYIIRINEGAHILTDCLFIDSINDSAYRTDGSDIYLGTNADAVYGVNMHYTAITNYILPSTPVKLRPIVKTPAST
jgi:Pectate lyase superfamily protein